MVTCWERANLLAPLIVMFYCVFVTFLCGVLCKVLYLIVLIPDLCLLTYFVRCETKSVVNVNNKDFFPIQIYFNILTIVKGSY